MMADLMEEIARSILGANGAPLTAGDAEWPLVMAHFRRMEAEHGERYTSARSLVNDAIRNARTALAAIDAAGFAVVPKEPTREMLIASHEAALAWMRRHGVTGLSPYSDYPNPTETTKVCFMAMLAAAPKVTP